MQALSGAVLEVPAPRYFFPDSPDLPLPEGHRFPAEKYRLVRQKVVEEYILPACELAAAPAIDPAVLRLVHAPGYIDTILHGSLDRKAELRLGIPLSDVLRRRALLTVGAAVEAARVALRSGRAATLAGGTHHAHRDFAAGYCVFNDLAVAAALLRSEGLAARVAILDCDVHQGDGTAALMHGEPDVLTVDLYGEKNYPARKVAPDLAYPLPDGTADDEYLNTLQRALVAIDDFRPDIVLYNAGVDPLAEDRLGRLSLSMGGLLERDGRVFKWARSADCPIVSVAGGGYSMPLSLTVHAYAQTLRAMHDAFS